MPSLLTIGGWIWELPRYFELIEEARKKRRVPIRLGSSAITFPAEEWIHKLASMPNGLLIGSVHYLTPDWPSIIRLRRRYNEYPAEELWSMYWSAAENASAAGCSILSRTDLVKIFGSRPSGI